ncbi:MAG: hypothetical protein HKP12_07220 [Gammaproteobacteria bacterium]|nr:hypothetical protein [Gammaproteobacteria bacterium]
MNSIARIFGGIALATGMSLSTPAMTEEASPLAESEITIGFENDSRSGDEFISAETSFQARHAVIWNAFAAITEYPNLHKWIGEARFVGDTDDGTQEFLIEFKFPWPIGTRWSRVEVTREHGAEISWRQIEGDLNANQGRISFSSKGDQAHIHYRAIISVGVPAMFARPYKKKFVYEFLNAIKERVTTKPDSAPSMALVIQ